jgi:D-alanyl-D-alanine carboxypeptidase
MTRPLRIEYPGAVYHVTSRGNEKKAIFKDDQDRENFLKELARIGSWDISAYIRDMNQQSLNVAADNLLFLLGAETFGDQGTREKGIQAVNDFLTKLGVPQAGIIESISDPLITSVRNSKFLFLLQYS